MKQLKLLPEELDKILAIQFAIAWAGEGGEEPRLNWWNTEVISEFGGYDNLKELAPNSADWLGFKTIREAARRTDQELRLRASHPDKIVTIYCLGFEIDEQLDQRLSEHIHSRVSLAHLLKNIGWLTEPVGQEWEQEEFVGWLQELSQQKAKTEKESIGRRLIGDIPENIVERVQKLATALLPLSENYPFPHYRVM